VLAVSDFNSTAVALLVAGAGAGIGFAVLFAVRFAASFPALPPPGPETQELGEEPPAVASLLVNRCSVTGAAEAATLVDLAARRHLELLEVGPDHYVVRLRPDRPDDLTSYERQILELVRARATGGSAPLEAILLDDDEEHDWHGDFRKAVVRDAKARGLLRGRWSRSDWVLFALLAGAALLLVAAGLFVAHVEQTGRTATSGSRSGRFTRDGWWWVALITWGIVLAVIASLRSIRYSAAGQSVTSRWLGVRRYLRHDASFGNAPPAAVAIWGRLLSYGAALGVARATSAAIPFATEGPGTAWSRYGGDWHQVHVEYPKRFGYGQRPRRVLLGGLARVIFWGALAFAVLPVVVDALWRVGSDAVDKSSATDATVTILVGVFFVVFGAIGVYLLVQLADGLVRLWFGARDLGHPGSVEGEVVKVLQNGDWFAVDPGHVDHVRAWHPNEGSMPVRQSMVRVSVSPHLGYVTAIDVLQRAATPPVPPSEPAGVGVVTRPAMLPDAAAVQACTGMALPEVDPASLAGRRGHIPPGSQVRAFSDGTSRVLIAATDAGRVLGAAPAAVGQRIAAAASGGRWTGDKVLLQLGPAGLVVVDVELAGRSSSDRERIARTLAARVTGGPEPGAPATTAAPGAPDPRAG